MSGSGSALSARDIVVVRGGARILDAVSFELRCGELTALLGPNGAGKSTLLRVLAGALTAEAGAVELDGKPLASWAPAQRAARIAYLPQLRDVAWNLGVFDLVSLGRLHRATLGRLDDTDIAACERAMRDTDVAHLGARAARTLSGGELARVLLARALAAETPILLADEPAAGLDPRHQLDSMTVLRRRADAGAACCVVLHDLTLVARSCDRVVLLNQGRVAGDGAPATVLTDAALEAAYRVRVARFDAAIVPTASIGD